MLSKEAEHFLLKLRTELMIRGKKDDDINEIEEQLKDHLIAAEKNGETVESITGGSVENYIKSISNELPFDNTLLSFLPMVIIGCISLFIIPDLLKGELNFTLFRTIYYFLILFIMAPIQLTFLKKLIFKYGDQRKTYIYGMLIAVLGFLIMVLCEWLLRKSSSPVLFHLDEKTSFYLGILLSIIFIIVCIWRKNWLLIGVLLYIIAPDLIARVLTNQTASQKEYIEVNSWITIALNLIVILLLVVFFSREAKNKN